MNYKQISESLKLLVLPYEEQKSYFLDFVDLPFELLDTYHNAFLLIPNLIENKYYDYDVIANLIRLENIITFTINNPSFDSMDETVLIGNEDWNRIRNLSKEILKQMNEPIEKPDRNYI